MVIVQAATLAYAREWDDLGSVLFRYFSTLLQNASFDCKCLNSLALSVKMSVLLYVPGLLVLLFKRHGLLHTFRHGSIILFIQILIAFPFLRAHPWSYLASAFEFSRVFLYKWTVNWRFLSEEVFLSKAWTLTLLVGHLGTLVAFVWLKWCRGDGGVWSVLGRGFRKPTTGAGFSRLSSDRMLFLPCFLVCPLTRRCRISHHFVHVQLDRNHLFTLVALSVLQLVRTANTAPPLADAIPYHCSVCHNPT